MKRKGGPSPEGRVCTVCGEAKTDADFYPTKTTRNTCIACAKNVNKQAALKRMSDADLQAKIDHHNSEIQLIETEMLNRASARHRARALELGLKMLQEESK